MTILQRARKRLGLKQDDIAELLGVTQATVSLWERRRATPPVSQWTDLAREYGITWGRVRAHFVEAA